VPKPDYILDVKNMPQPPEEGGDQQSPKGLAGRKWLSISFQCCSTYGRIYMQPDGSAYSGFCPKCGQPVRARVGAGGTSCRFFTVD